MIVPGANAEIVAVGSEMLTPSKTDTNSLWLTDQLNALGIEVVLKCIVGDDKPRLTEIVQDAFRRSEIVIVTGGLGPTEDDVTRDCVAVALGRSLSYKEELSEAIAARFRLMGRKMVEINKRQAFLIDGAEALPNDRGTAPGQWLQQNGKLVILLPGPPRELKAMYELQVLPRLRNLLPPQVIQTRIYRISCMPESDVDQLVSPVYSRYTNPSTTILAAAGDIQLHLRARCATAAEAASLLQELGSQIEQLLGDRIYTCGGEPLESCVGGLLRTKGATLAVAESITGGSLAEHITSVAGSSDYFKGGFLTYTNQVKTDLLGVPADLLERETAVSAPVAEAMAVGAMQRLQSTYALSITGIAGPGGGADATPAGTVFIGVAGPAGVSSKRLHFVGDRSRVRMMSVVWALDLLRRELLRN